MNKGTQSADIKFVAALEYEHSSKYTIHFATNTDLYLFLIFKSSQSCASRRGIACLACSFLRKININTNGKSIRYFYYDMFLTTINHMITYLSNYLVE